MKNDDIAERFARDTGPHTHDEYLPYGMYGPCRLVTDRPHEMTILHDDGLYRHLRFKSPDHGAYWFDIITWPGSLTARGDLNDSYVFSRASDMVAFFRGNSSKGSINPGYWSEKLDGSRDRTMTYSEDLFRKAVWEHVRAYGQDHRGLAKAVQEHFFDRWGDWDISREDQAREALDAFRFGGSFTGRCSCGSTRNLTSDEFTDAEHDGRIWQTMHRGTGHTAASSTVPAFRFVDTWEWSFRDFDWSFLWACHAIVFGVARYDEARKTAVAAEPVLVTGGVL